VSRDASAPRIVRPREPLRDGMTALRAWRQDDIPALTRLCRDAEIVRFIGVPENYSDTDARDYITSREESLRAGVSVDFAIAEASADGALLGSISLMRFAWPDRRAEVGYWLGAPARGHGHATRAVGLICRWGFRELGLERIELLAATINGASQRVAERAGFTREAHLRAYSYGPGGREDMFCFGLLAEATRR
jgi:RimJ/RimL family protein N-acetyltransferase